MEPRPHAPSPVRTTSPTANDPPGRAIVTLYCTPDGGRLLGLLAPDGRSASARLPEETSRALAATVDHAAVLAQHRSSLLRLARQTARGRWEPVDVITRRGLGLEGPGYGGAPFGAVVFGGPRYFGMGHWGIDLGELALDGRDDMITAHSEYRADGVRVTYEPGGFAAETATVDEAVAALADQFADHPRLAGRPVQASCVASFNMPVFMRLDEPFPAPGDVPAPDSERTLGGDAAIHERLTGLAERLAAILRARLTRPDGVCGADIALAGLSLDTVRLSFSPWVCLEMQACYSGAHGHYWQMNDLTWTLCDPGDRERVSRLYCAALSGTDVEAAADQMERVFRDLRQARLAAFQAAPDAPAPDPLRSLPARALGWLRAALGLGRATSAITANPGDRP